MKRLTFDEWSEYHAESARAKFQVLSDEYGDACPFSEPRYVQRCYDDYLDKCDMEQWNRE